MKQIFFISFCFLGVSIMDSADFAKCSMLRSDPILHSPHSSFPDPILHSGIGVACGENTQFKRLYDFYFPKHNGGLASFYRQGFDETLFKLPSGPQDERRHRELYFAFHGNPKAFHKFVHNVDREGAGEFALTWTYECVLLLLKLGDDQFAALLATEDKQTREIVGQTIDSQINWSKHHFPKTRALYSYRTTSSARWRQ